MDVSVIYVNWNAEDEILASVRTVRDKIRGVSYEIIVVDNASGKGTAALARTGNPIDPKSGQCRIRCRVQPGRPEQPGALSLFFQPRHPDGK